MATTIISPHFMEVDGWRQVVRNNKPITHVCFVVHTDNKWLPQVLNDAGFFPSNGEVKRNRPDLWRELKTSEEVKLSWAHILICLHGQCPPANC